MIRFASHTSPDCHTRRSTPEFWLCGTLETVLWEGEGTTNANVQLLLFSFDNNFLGERSGMQ